MSLSDNSNASGMVMPVAPMNGYGNGGYGGFLGGDGLWFIVLLLIFANNGWGGNGFGNGGGTTYVANDVQRGFDQATLTNGINGISTGLCNGFSAVQQSLCNGFAGVNGAISNGFAQAEIANNARQMADMNQQFAIQSALQNCCCQQAANTADLKYTVATEACADRNAISDALRDVIASNTANTQAILDKLCQQEIDALKTENANLQTQLNLANLGASQNAQTAAILADNAAQTAALLPKAPVAAYVVQNPNCCGQNYYGGCGCGNVVA